MTRTHAHGARPPRKAVRRGETIQKGRGETIQKGLRQEPPISNLPTRDKHLGDLRHVTERRRSNIRHTILPSPNQVLTLAAAADWSTVTERDRLPPLNGRCMINTWVVAEVTVLGVVFESVGEVTLVVPFG